MCGSFFYGCGPRRRHAGRGWGFDPSFMAGFWGRPGHRRGGPFRGGRMFEQGDLKYVILQLLDEKPRHGYDIIKALEERSGGTYSPSPGTVYPTLTMLEDMGYARTTTEEGGKKIYEITPEGKAYLAENRSTVNDIFDRIADFGSNFFGGPMMGVNHAFKDLARAIYTTAPRHSSDVERLTKIKTILERAAREVDELERGSSGAGGQSGTAPAGQGGPAGS
ncbi:MAG TPA: PadR family transcriptional regulator [Gemmatimonadaceae bacterium]|nr:PadR family transcriptional regulator [Gemmatimonadaceae bacterium]